MERGAWQATVHAITKSWTRLSDFYFILSCQGLKANFFLPLNIIPFTPDRNIKRCSHFERQLAVSYKVKCRLNPVILLLDIYPDE